MDPRIRRAYDIIKIKYQDKLLLKGLAEEVGLSSFYFQRLFKREMNETPSECLTRIRLQRASHLMVIDSEMTMADIAYDCGFSSPSAFSRSFTKAYGRSPAVYSRSLRALNLARQPAAPSSELIIRDPEVIYFPGCWIIYSHTSVFWNRLFTTFQSVKAFCDLEGIAGQTGALMGVFTHIHLAFHGPQDQLNYYAGVEVAPKPHPKYRSRLFRIPEGRYARFSTNTSYQDLFALKVKFKTEWMDPQSLLIRDTFAFERISTENSDKDYPYLEREIYTPVR